ncbi:L,D-transpeptidase family protein [Arthrobacter crystallopoietes]|uniref:L,D-transpeptidase family protein n=1 Tax=Crystallibacter crystallopoietes TaxID=37928 RepID=UPI003D1D9201
MALALSALVLAGFPAQAATAQQAGGTASDRATAAATAQPSTAAASEPAPSSAPAAEPGAAPTTGSVSSPATEPAPDPGTGAETVPAPGSVPATEPGTTPATEPGTPAPAEPSPAVPQTGAPAEGTVPPSSASPSPASPSPNPEPERSQAAAANDGREAIEAKAEELKLVPHNEFKCGLAGDGCVRTYTSEPEGTKRIAIYWSPATGAHAVDLQHYVGSVFKLARYEAGEYGYPASDLVTDGAGNASQTFQHGKISATRGELAVDDRARELRLLPVNDFKCGLAGGGCVRSYKPSASSSRVIAVYWSADTGAHPVELTHAVGKTYRAAGWEGGKLGYPTSDMATGLKGKGARQSFEHGQVAYSPATGAVPVLEPFLAAWQKRGSQDGSLGYPKGWAKTTAGVLHQPYQGGVLVAGSAGVSVEKTHVFHGQRALDARAKQLRYVPVNGYNCNLVGSGCVRTYKYSSTSTARVALYWTAKTGVRAVNLKHAVGRKFAATGYERGVMGYPTSDVACGLRGSGCVQPFQKGQISYSPAAGAHTMSAQILHSWKQRGGAGGALGYPIQDSVSRSGRTTQVFQSGSLVAANVGAVMYPKNECWALGAHKTRYAHYWKDRISFAISEKYGTYKASFINCVRVGSVYRQEWKTTKATVGLSGFKKPGVASGHTMYRWSPQGSFSVTESFGEGNPGTGLAYRKLNSRSQWSGTPGGGYNKYFESSFNRWPDEQMYNIMRAPTGDYRQGAVINYNRPPDSPIRQGAGFAIFLHANPVPTYGCIALDLSNVTKYLKTAKPGDRIVMGVRADIFKS